jgi:8-oxo-dGTP pyrophosphatase MutT (NUDIX family)
MTDHLSTREPEFALVAPDDPALRPSAELATAIDAVRAACVVDALAEEHRRSVLDFLHAHPDSLERTCALGHLTGSAVVVDSTASRTLLMLHRKLGRWFQPGGHADGDGNLAHVASREATEETGLVGLRIALPALDIDVHRVEPPGEVPHLHLDVRYLALAPDGAVEVGNEESLALRWVTEADLEALGADPSTRRLVHRGLAVAASLLG